MSYYFTTTIESSFEKAIEHVTAALADEGFGVLTEINVNATLKKKLDVEFYRYQILGACHPQSAYQALQLEDKIGAMLPCNVILQEKEVGKVEVSAVDPLGSMMAVQNDKLGAVAQDVQSKLRKVIDAL
ncbi:MAG: DUF302 domain-containing protein [Calditrichaeota bacterium]|nr:MAG: DUF302 domain-containing protein [Calditrichota bacterium]